MKRKRWKSAPWTIGKISISAAIFYLVCSKFKLPDLIQAIQSISWEWFALGAVQLLLVPLLGGGRWLLTLRAMGENDRWWPMTRLFWIGMLFGQVLPSQAGGDAIRVLLAHWRGHRLGVAARSVMLERLLMVLTLLAFVCVLMPLMISRLGGMHGLTWAAPALLAAGAVGVGLLMYGDFILGRIRIPASLLRISQSAARVASDSRRVYLSRPALIIVLLALSTHVNQVLFSVCLGKAIGMELSLLDYLSVIPLIFISTLLPISIGGWGVREGVSVVLLGLLGIEPSKALLFSVLMGGAVVLSSVPAIPMWWVDAKRRPARLPEGVV